MSEEQSQLERSPIHDLERCCLTYGVTPALCVPNKGSCDCFTVHHHEAKRQIDGNVVDSEGAMTGWMCPLIEESRVKGHFKAEIRLSFSLGGF